MHGSDPPLPMKPALHMQFSMVLEPSSIDNVFAGHIKHAAEPASDLNLPASHFAHAPSFVLVEPALQVHAV